MTDDDFPDLHEFVRAGEDRARPLPAAEVRRLGGRRRTRRHVGAVAVALAAVVAAGGTAVSYRWSDADRAPDVVATPSRPVAPTIPVSTPGPATRTVGPDNLIAAGQIPRNWGDDPLLVTDPGVGRPLDAVTVCIPDGGWPTLGATGAVTRNFRIDYRPPGFSPSPQNPMYGQPQIYTAALQFTDAAAATAAAATIRGWLADCPATLEERGYQVDAGPTRFVDVPGSTTPIGEYAGLPSYLPAGFTGPADSNGEKFIEHVGLTRVDDRLMISVEVLFSSEYLDSDLPDGDPGTGLPANLQFGLVRAAAERLAR